jgi:hypothetical protein
MDAGTITVGLLKGGPRPFGGPMHKGTRLACGDGRRYVTTKTVTALPGATTVVAPIAFDRWWIRLLLRLSFWR